MVLYWSVTRKRIRGVSCDWEQEVELILHLLEAAEHLGEKQSLCYLPCSFWGKRYEGRKGCNKPSPHQKGECLPAIIPLLVGSGYTRKWQLWYSLALLTSIITQAIESLSFGEEGWGKPAQPWLRLSLVPSKNRKSKLTSCPRKSFCPHHCRGKIQYYLRKLPVVWGLEKMMAFTQDSPPAFCPLFIRICWENIQKKKKLKITLKAALSK